MKKTTPVCLNCQTRRRPVYRLGHCRKCCGWHEKKRKFESIARSAIGIESDRAQRKATAAARILKEYSWREAPLIRNEADAFHVEALVYTVASECRSGFGFALHSSLDDLTPEARICIYCILLEIVEHIPATSPRFHTLSPPPRGSYLRPAANSGLIGEV